ncbi:hypothetical protein [Frankia sp. CiP3]|uniref:hypothetical protein n=1 Tax=Frankia sp. CiP3 TaxID=2880971 RepID=UPI001EF6B5F1|nr:hypothetical protein [Frankia sp. CiP3]
MDGFSRNHQCRRTFGQDPWRRAAPRVLIGFCCRLGLPFGINVEILTNRKVEIDASIDLAREIRSQPD